VSDFANTRLGWLFVAATTVHGAGNLALASGWGRTFEAGMARAWAILLLAAAATGILVAGLFPIDAAGSPPTWVGLLHRSAVMASFVLELGAIFLFSRLFGAQPDWRSLAATSFALSTVAAVSFMAFLLAGVIDWRQGLAERVALTSFLAWELWAALQLARRGVGNHVSLIP